MTTQTVAPLMRNLAVLDSLLGRGLRAELPLPTTAVSANDYGVSFQWDDATDLELWAEWLDVQATEHATDDGLHVSAEATVDGARVRLASFLRIEVAS